MKKLILTTIITTILCGQSTPQKLTQINEVFIAADSNKDGKISRSQLEDYIEIRRNNGSWKHAWSKVKKYSKKAYSATIELFNEENKKEDQIAMDKKVFTEFYDIIIKDNFQQPSKKQL